MFVIIYKNYGKTGKKVSAVGFGGMRFDASMSRTENADLVKYAFSKGITYFDTAPGYDDSEDIFGAAFKDMPRDKYFVSTKGMPTNTAQEAVSAVKRSMDRMGVSKIDFYHVWCIRMLDHFYKAMKPDGQYEALLRLKEEGLIDHIVFSSHLPGNQVKTIIDAGVFEGVLIGVSILDFQYRWEAVEYAYGKGYGVVAMNPLAGGLIPTHEKELAFLGSRKDTGSGSEQETPTEAALRFVISSPQITVALNGFSTKAHVDMACKVADHAKPFTQQDLDTVKEKIGGGMSEACTGCGYCWDCPKEIPVPTYMQFYNEKQVFGLSDADMRRRTPEEQQWGRLAMRKANAGDCAECGLCEERCTQHLPIIKRLQEIAEWEEGK